MGKKWYLHRKQVKFLYLWCNKQQWVAVEVRVILRKVSLFKQMPTVQGSILVCRPWESYRLCWAYWTLKLFPDFTENHWKVPMFWFPSFPSLAIELRKRDNPSAFSIPNVPVQLAALKRSVSVIFLNTFANFGIDRFLSHYHTNISTLATSLSQIVGEGERCQGNCGVTCE